MGKGNRVDEDKIEVSKMENTSCIAEISYDIEELV